MSKEDKIDPYAQLKKLQKGDPTAKIILSKWLEVKQGKAQEGDLDAQVAVGWSHYEGASVPKDELKGVELWKRAAELGSPTAMGNLALHYSKQKGKEDSSESYKWCRKGAELGDSFSQYLLGTKLLNGVGVSSSLEEAVHWLIQAAENGIEEAFNSLSEILSNYDRHHIFDDGTGDALSALLNFLTSLAENGDGFAKYTLDLRAKATGVSKIELSKEVVEVFLGGFIDDELNIYTSIENDAAEALVNDKKTLRLQLNGITSLSEEASQHLSKLSVNILELKGLTELSVATARLLSKQPLIYLECLTELSDEAAEVLISNERKQQHVGLLYLNGLTKLSDSVAISLSQYGGDCLKLNGIHSLSDTAADSLSRFQYELHLNGLNSLSSASLARKLADMNVRFGEVQGESLALDFKNLVGLSDAAAECFSRHEGDLWLKRLSQLSDSATQSLSMHRGTLFLSPVLKAKVEAFKQGKMISDIPNIEPINKEFSAKKSDFPTVDAAEGKILTKEIAEEFLQKDPWDDIDLYEFTTITEEAAEALSGNFGPWSLDGLTTLSVTSAASLSKQKCQAYWIRNGLYLNGLQNICNEVAHYLSFHRGELELNGLKELSDSAAESLSLHWGTLSLDGLNELSDSAAESFSGFFGIGSSKPWLSLNGLAELSDSATEHLSLFKGSKLNLGGLKKLSKTGAQNLSNYEGQLSLPSVLQAKVDAFKKN